MAEPGLCTGKIDHSIHDTIAVIIRVGKKMSYLHDFHYASFVDGKGPASYLHVSHLYLEMASAKGQHFA